MSGTAGAGDANGARNGATGGLKSLAWMASVVLNALLIGFFLYLVLTQGLPAGRMQLVLAVLMLVAPGTSLIALTLLRPA